MVQQMAIHEQGRKLMVQTNVITSKQDDAGKSFFRFRRWVPETSFQ